MACSANRSNSWTVRTLQAVKDRLRKMEKMIGKPEIDFSNGQSSTLTIFNQMKKI
jgi:hypothetical protein